MFNSNSPIVNNMMNAGGSIYSNGYIPASPIGNIASIGNVGYNNNGMNNMNGYYNNSYNGYYNPYLAAQQQEIQILKQKEQARCQSDMLKNLSRKVNVALDTGIDMDEHLKMYDPLESVQQDPEESITQRLMQVHYNAPMYNPMTVRLIQGHNNVFEQVKQQIPDDISMYDFNSKSAELYVQCLRENQRNQQRDVSKLYDSNTYNQLIKMHGNSSNYFNSMFSGMNSTKDINIDDMEIKLPNHLANEFQNRRKAFLDSILNK